jgi:hypothetical protein
VAQPATNRGLASVGLKIDQECNPLGSFIA